MNSNKKISDSEALDIVLNGTFYCPAWKHHNNQITIVYCDYCHKSQLLSSIGYKQMDLCLQCVEMITRYIADNNIKPNDISLSSNNNTPANSTKTNKLIDSQTQTQTQTDSNCNNKIIEMKSNDVLTIIGGNITIVNSNINLTHSSNNINETNTNVSTNSNLNFNKEQSVKIPNSWNFIQTKQNETNTNTKLSTNTNPFNLPTNSTNSLNQFQTQPSRPLQLFQQQQSNTNLPNSFIPSSFFLFNTNK